MRFTFGGAIPDFLAAPYDATSIVGGSGAEFYASVAQVSGITAWSDQNTGVQYTDLLDANGNAITSVSAISGQLPLFSGPDGVTVVWLDAGGGRGMLRANNAADLLASGAFVGAASPALTGMPTINGQTLTDFVNGLIVSGGGGTSVNVPGQPTNVTATSGGLGQSIVSWSPPSFIGASAVTYYLIAWSGSDGSTGTATDTASPYTLTLPAGPTYSLTITAYNSNGAGTTSAASNSFTVAAPTVPGAPTLLLPATSGGVTSFAWVAPTSTGSTSLTGYNLRVDGTLETTPGNVPGAPVELAPDTSTAGEVVITWQAPSYAGSSAITGYNVEIDGVLQLVALTGTATYDSAVFDSSTYGS